MFQKDFEGRQVISHAALIHLLYLGHLHYLGQMLLAEFLVKGLQNKEMKHKMYVKIHMYVCIKMQYPQRMQYLHVKKSLRTLSL